MAGATSIPAAPFEHAIAMAEAGAAIIDVGGESTKPIGAREVPVAVEIQRVRPVLERLGRELRIPISIDTRRAEVARIALDNGATIVNDISAMSDPAMAALVRSATCAVVLMHMRGGPQDHIKFARYRNVVAEVRAWLASRARAAIASGIERSRIIIDPGIGFAKTARHNVALIAALPRLCALGYPYWWAHRASHSCARSCTRFRGRATMRSFSAPRRWTRSRLPMEHRSSACMIRDRRAR